MKMETRKMDILYLVGDDDTDLASYCSEDGFHANVEGLDPDLESDMFKRMSEGQEDGDYEMSN